MDPKPLIEVPLGLPPRRRRDSELGRRNTPWQRVFLFAAAVSGLAAVSAGAFGAHALKGVLSQDDLTTWDTAARCARSGVMFEGGI